ncbi:NADH-quinone oxidoreductase subunit C [Thermochromatium tepidum]|jgi:Ni,Fe-hydrogenase III component G|uniref:NADH-quinone oxidoreductase subunit C n=1 Tax=Thermochromatium tepidum ATCC 43061 TaxID=316276 RepID=A0A6I6E5P2_THETI|nr:NADH-quinone oxidoreductase subunit C [Thermochromatium tepidum]QGU31788.1 NADH-quinone oxidoreductase subunit C [Thermochromatium tepidum ATCC 43061]
MSLGEPFKELTLDQWVSTAEQHRRDGFRLVQMMGTARPDHFEILISYERDGRCTHYRVLLPRDPRPELPSLSAIFPAAFTYENELKDLFGLSFAGLTVDYGGNFLRTKVKLPFSGAVTLKKEPAKPAAKSAPET